MAYAFSKNKNKLETPGDLEDKLNSLQKQLSNLVKNSGQEQKLEKNVLSTDICTNKKKELSGGSILAMLKALYKGSPVLKFIDGDLLELLSEGFDANILLKKYQAHSFHLLTSFIIASTPDFFEWFTEEIDPAAYFGIFANIASKTPNLEGNLFYNDYAALNSLSVYNAILLDTLDHVGGFEEDILLWIFISLLVVGGSNVNHTGFSDNMAYRKRGKEVKEALKKWSFGGNYLGTQGVNLFKSTSEQAATTVLTNLTLLMDGRATSEIAVSQTTTAGEFDGTVDGQALGDHLTQTEIIDNEGTSNFEVRVFSLAINAACHSFPLWSGALKSNLAYFTRKIWLEYQESRLAGYMIQGQAAACPAAALGNIRIQVKINGGSQSTRTRRASGDFKESAENGVISAEMNPTQMQQAMTAYTAAWFGLTALGGKAVPPIHKMMQANVDGIFKAGKYFAALKKLKAGMTLDENTFGDYLGKLLT